MSNLGQDGDVQRAMEAGATAYFIKMMTGMCAVGASFFRALGTSNPLSFGMIRSSRMR